VAGEEAHAKGEDGLQRAKHWLDSSTRLKRVWTSRDRSLGQLCHFEWPHATGQMRPFSFDLGGNFQGGSLHDQSFLAEVKNYRYESDLPVEFRKFQAKCYVALMRQPSLSDHFLWISWAPFQAGKWDKHATVDSVCAALKHKDNRNRLFGVDTEADAVTQLDKALAAQVANRIWLVTLCDQQEQLVLMGKYHKVISSLMAEEYGS